MKSSPNTQEFLNTNHQFKRGIALGHAVIHTDELHFEFRNKDGKFERFSFPTIALSGMTEFNGYFYTCPVKKLRKLAEKMEKSKGK